MRAHANMATHLVQLIASSRDVCFRDTPQYLPYAIQPREGYQSRYDSNSYITASRDGRICEPDVSSANDNHLLEDVVARGEEDDRNEKDERPEGGIVEDVAPDCVRVGRPTLDVGWLGLQLWEAGRGHGVRCTNASLCEFAMLSS